MVVLPANILESDVSINMTFQLETHPPSRHQHSHVLWEPTPTTNKIEVNFDTHTFLSPWGLASFLPKQIYLQNLKHLFYDNKTLQGGPYDHNVYKCTHQGTYNHVCEHDEHVYAMICVHAYVEYVSFETQILIVCGLFGHIYCINTITFLHIFYDKSLQTHLS